MPARPKVLICPQHWGLGHVTRTIPVIRYFLSRQYQVLLASSGAGADLLRMEFPELRVIELPDYGMRYPFKNMYLNMGLQLFQMHRAIVKEHFAIRRICREEGVGLIISDARLGASQKGIPSAIITHHLHFPLDNFLSEWMSDVWMRFFYMRFNQIWVPDVAGEINLSGALSHQFKSAKHYFIGVLSRFKPMNADIRYDYAFVLSGPEPQRSLFEDILLKQMKMLGKVRCILIRGTKQSKPIQGGAPGFEGELEIRDLISGDELNHVLCATDWIVCRSGYSSLLDLSVLRKKALVIPTPGQPEQEYLAKELTRKKLFYSTTQDLLDLSKDIPLSKTYPGYSQMDFGLSLEDRLDPLVFTLLLKKGKSRNLKYSRHTSD